jgi:hypothetical protein
MSIPSIINKSSITITSFVAVDEALVGLVFVIYSVFASTDERSNESNIDESSAPKTWGKLMCRYSSRFDFHAFSGWPSSSSERISKLLKTNHCEEQTSEMISQ